MRISILILHIRLCGQVFLRVRQGVNPRKQSLYRSVCAVFLMSGICRIFVLLFWGCAFLCAAFFLGTVCIFVRHSCFICLLRFFAFSLLFGGRVFSCAAFLPFGVICIFVWHYCFICPPRCFGFFLLRRRGIFDGIVPPPRYFFIIR